MLFYQHGDETMTAGLKRSRTCVVSPLLIQRRVFLAGSPGVENLISSFFPEEVDESKMKSNRINLKTGIVVGTISPQHRADLNPRSSEFHQLGMLIGSFGDKWMRYVVWDSLKGSIQA